MRVYVDVNPPSAVLLASPTAAPVLADHATPCPEDGRGPSVEGLCEAERCRRMVLGGPKRKGLRCSLGPREHRTSPAEAVGAKRA